MGVLRAVSSRLLPRLVGREKIKLVGDLDLVAFADSGRYARRDNGPLPFLPCSDNASGDIR